MGFCNKYFSVGEFSPEALIAMTKRRVRFEEVDALGMVWHGRYASYLEDGRIAFGDKYGLTYQSFRENKTVAPIVQMHLDYKAPLHFDESFQIETTLHWSDAARLNFSYKIFNRGGDVTATAYTVQLFTDPEGSVLLILPDWLLYFRKNWQESSWGKR